MKFILGIFFCLLFAVQSIAQESVPTPPQTVGIDEVYLAKDDGAGKMGDITDTFLTTDIPIYCVVLLDSMTPATVKMNLIAVEVKGVKAETKVITVSFKTNGKQNRVNFTGTPDNIWTAGKYRVDIFIDGRLAQSRDFEIQNAVTESDSVKSFQPKPKPKPKKPVRKN